MGLSGGSTTKTSTSTTKPVYEQQIMGAYNDLQDAFNGNKQNIQGIQGMLGGLLPQAQANYANNGTLNAAKGYITGMLSNPYSASPELDNIVQQGEADAVNGVTTSLGTRGLAGGSAMARLAARQAATVGSQLRYNDYNNWQNRQMQAAGMAPSIGTADNANLSGLLGLSDRAANTVTDNALKQAMGVGGLLGNYTTTNSKEKTQQSGGLGSILGPLLSLGSLAFGGGGLGGLLGGGSSGLASSAAGTIADNPSIF